MIKKSSKDIRQQVTDKIIAALEHGTVPWRCPWDRTQCGIPVNLKTGDDYHGFNAFYLTFAQVSAGYSTRHWLTYKQAQMMGGQVRKGEHGIPAVFYKSYDKETDKAEDSGEPKTEKILVLRYFTVFNLNQIDGIEPPAQRPRFSFEPIEAAEKIVKTSGIPVLHGGVKAYYKLRMDMIGMPDRDRFSRAEDYYATVMHELTHATKHPSRCNRQMYETTIPEGAYAFEELVAEIGSLLCMTALGLEGEIASLSNDYIDSWLSVLKSDKSAIFKAAAQAELAYQWLMKQLPAEDSYSAVA